MHKLGALLLMTSQGIPFMHQGQEWGNTKIIAGSESPDVNIGKIDRNSYNKDNETNWMDWNEFFNPNTYPMVGKDSEAYERIVQKIKKHKVVTKRQLIGEMNWGVSFKFGRYRNRLRLDKRIKFLIDGYEWVG